MDKIKIGISIGDINGVGLEVIIKTLADPRICNLCTPVIYGSSKVLSYHKNIVGIEEFQYQNVKSVDRLYRDKVNIINCWQDDVNISIGKMTEEGGRFAKISLEAAVNDLKSGHIDALVTAPIHKKAMQLAKFAYPGHTEYLTEEFGGKSLMLMVNNDLRIGVVTGHIAVKDIQATLNKELLIKKLVLMSDCLKKDFAIERPTIAILGLNPHAGDEGLMGEEEEKFIRPVIIEAKKKGMIVMGPYSADGFFGSGQYKKFDGILAMYHDQGLIPFKTLSFGNGVNYTAGLTAVRTSPDHGTAFDIAGTNVADPASFRQAIFLAVDVARNRKRYKEDHANPLKSREKTVEKQPK